MSSCYTDSVRRNRSTAMPDILSALIRSHLVIQHLRILKSHVTCCISTQTHFLCLLQSDQMQHVYLTPLTARYLLHINVDKVLINTVSTTNSCENSSNASTVFVFRVCCLLRGVKTSWVSSPFNTRYCSKLLTLLGFAGICVLVSSTVSYVF